MIKTTLVVVAPAASPALTQSNFTQPLTQAPAGRSATADGRGAAADEAAELAKQLSKPVANLIMKSGRTYKNSL